MLAAAARRLTQAPAHEAAEALGGLRTRYVELAAARAEIAAYGLADRVTGELSALTGRLDGARARLHRGEGALAALLAGYAAVAVVAILVTASRPAPWVALALLATAGSIEAMAALARTAFRQASVAEGLRRIAGLEALDGQPFRAETDPAVGCPVRLGALTLASGERVALIGRSGSGKTLLLDALAGIGAVEVGRCG